MTRDTLPPAFVAPETADTDGNGRIDRVDLRYSEDVQGGTSAAPFTVTGRTVTGVEFVGPRARIVIAEAGSPDTADRRRPATRLRALPADRVGTCAEGAGRHRPRTLPASRSSRPTTRPGPAIVEAVTGDSSGAADGTGRPRVADLLRAGDARRRSRPGRSRIALEAPHAVCVGVRRVSGDQHRREHEPRGLSPTAARRPTSRVSDPAKVTDAAGNPANGATFSGTRDGVRPVLLSARLGEVDGGRTRAWSRRPRTRIVDCMSVDWSEAVDPRGQPEPDRRRVHRERADPGVSTTR